MTSRQNDKLTKSQFNKTAILNEKLKNGPVGGMTS